MRRICLMLFLMSALVACANRQDSSLPGTESTSAQSCYEDFLAGKREAKDGENTIHINSLFRFDGEEQIEHSQYALFDMNGDDIPELHIRSVGGYHIFTYREGQAALWRSEVPYSYPLNNGAIFYKRTGGAPNHTNYAYTICDYLGNEIYRIDFSEYGDGSENDLFLFDEIELSKENWLLLTKRYLSIQSNQIEWKSWRTSSASIRR